MLRIIIVDDEKKAINSLRWELDQLQEKFDLEIIATFTNPADAILGINSLQPDCLFLDIEMPKINGFSLLKELAYNNAEIVVTTAHSNFSLEAYKNKVLSYLLKPIDSTELEETLNRVLKIVGKRSVDTKVNNVLLKTNKLKLSFKDKWIFVLLDDILYCKSEGNYTEIFLKSGKKYVVSKKIKEFQHLLESQEIFYRVHNSYLININHITEIYKSDGAYIVLNNEKTIPISRNKKAAFLEYITNSFH
ncbi:MAG: response regulator transcription factor [Flavobacteriaceae bacterium]|nr:response regulator transcription factor [Flavobacteriaceae bacterium]